jgi:SAM-dependent methyltransferase
MKIFYPLRNIGKNIRTHRVNIIFGHIHNYLSVNEDILDIGAGDCFLAKRIKEETGANIIPVDVIDNNLTDLKLIIYDGLKLPFKDKSFDIVLIIYTLHHCTNIHAVLEEAKRVSRKKLIILEDIYYTKFGFFGLKLLDLWLGLLEGMSTPSNFKRPEEWELLFNQLNFKIEKKIHLGIDDKIFRVRHIMFVLTP